MPTRRSDRPRQKQICGGSVVLQTMERIETIQTRRAKRKAKGVRQESELSKGLQRKVFRQTPGEAQQYTMEKVNDHTVMKRQEAVSTLKKNATCTATTPNNRDLYVSNNDMDCAQRLGEDSGSEEDTSPTTESDDNFDFNATNNVNQDGTEESVNLDDRHDVENKAKVEILGRQRYKAKTHDEFSKDYVMNIGRTVARKFLRTISIFPDKSDIISITDSKRSYSSFVKKELPDDSPLKADGEFAAFYTSRIGSWLRCINTMRTSILDKCKDRFKGKEQGHTLSCDEFIKSHYKILPVKRHRFSLNETFAKNIVLGRKKDNTDYEKMFFVFGDIFLLQKFKKRGQYIGDIIDGTPISEVITPNMEAFMLTVLETGCRGD